MAYTTVDRAGTFGGKEQKAAIEKYVFSVKAADAEVPAKQDTEDTEDQHHAVADASKGAAMITFKFRADGLDAKNWTGKSDTYLVLARDGKNIKRTETVMRDLNPEWKTFSVSMEEFCGGDAAAEVTAEVWDWDRVTDDFIGSATLTLDTAKPGASWPLNNPKKMPGGVTAKKDYKNSGTLKIVECNVKEILQ